MDKASGEHGGFEGGEVEWTGNNLVLARWALECHDSVFAPVEEGRLLVGRGQRASHAPYSGCPSAWSEDSGCVYESKNGVNVEKAPSVPIWMRHEIPEN